jgi:hypothetical protein
MLRRKVNIELYVKFVYSAMWLSENWYVSKYKA